MISRVDYTALPSSFHSPSSFRGAPTHSRSAGASAAESNNSGGRKVDYTSISDVATLPGRQHRARVAFSIAGALVFVDGPLPVGDIAAATLLIGYGSYEVLKSASILFG